MDGKVLARIGAAAFVGLAATVTAIEMTKRDAAPPSPPVLTDHAPAPVDPMHRLLVRCQRLGAEATRDPVCLKAWADNRRRFLGSDRPAVEPSAGNR
ncbi:putative entry exclusion protein TrbK-alt [Pararhizobium mangrovi]|uniref:Conjugal transfer protein TrbK n=1 Tax=Pararhizobium mangrovi TaxID=2590452 RepID=A0A506U583_9HYPH|nr:putative entry exclusion protein TrbK-alt [Pararhizobium mangrovi]TPW28125.1 conjugal transfer protein TrbK [Pararhizobium mangrovi]